MTENPRPERHGDYDALYRSYIQSLKQVDHLSTLREIGLAITSSLDLEEVLTTIAHVVQGALDIRRVTLFELEKGGGAVRPIVAKFGRDLITRERLEEEHTPLHGTALGDALETRRTVLINTRYQSEAYVPLIANNRAVGVMRIDNPGAGEAFTADHASLFQDIGAQIAVAIDNAQLYSLAVTDGLTGLYVRRYFDLKMEEEMDEAKRYNRVFSLMMFDIDHFKKFNDTHGHQTGDMVLKQFANLIREHTRKSDVCCRYGGEEMAVVLPETNLREAALLANKMCERVRSMPFEGAQGEALHVTTSIGVSQYQVEYERPEEMLKAADDALYRAKEGGRDRVELAGI